MKAKTPFLVCFLALLSVAWTVLIFTDTGSFWRAGAVLGTAVYLFAVHFAALWFIVERLRGTQTARTVVVNISVSVIAISLLAISAEYSTRFLFRDVTTTGDNASFFSNRWLKTVYTNRLGFRERDFDVRKPPATYRIAIIGDSLAYGQGIPQADRFGEQIERHLNGLRRGPYEVLNFGVPGAETQDEVALLANTILAIQPDFILLQWYTNDVQSPEDKQHAPHPLTFIPSVLRWNSALFYLLHRQLNALQDRGLSEATNKYLDERFKDPSSPSSLRAHETMRTFIQVSRRFDIPLGMVLFSQTYFNPKSSLDFLLERTLKVCKDENVRCVDTRPLFEPYHGDTRLWANRFDPHPSSLANKLVAERLIETFGDVWGAR